jgi:soluble lytic murein transglycosylase
LALGPPAEPEDLKLALVLFENGLQTEARRTLRRLPIAAMSTNDRMVAAYLYRKYGEVSTAALLSRRAVQTEPIAATLLELAYPRPFDEYVEDASRDSKVPAALIYAIMREESYFDPRATSQRHALGLMQMLVPTAQSVARAAHVRFNPRQLYQPKTAIRLGAFYLAQLLKQNHGDIASTVAAYQAGERNVSRWRNVHDVRPPEVFVEDIPYNSTRSYVKKVLASYAIYRMHGGEVPSRAVQLFELPSVPFTTASVEVVDPPNRAAIRRR